MKLIDGFTMQPFTRLAWCSSAAKATWEKEIASCSTMIHELEIESVAAGQRSCSWQTMKREALPGFATRCAEKGLSVLPVRWIGNFDGFIHYTPPGDSSVYCIVARRIEDALAFQSAFEIGDHATQGMMLGFPKCCRNFFSREWKAGYFDPIWQSATSNYPLQMPEDNRLHRLSFEDCHPYSIPLLRYIGLRVGFHIQHSFNCPETIRAGEDRLSLARNRDTVKLLEALLSMPMEATLLHGILVVRTPIFYIIQYSVPTEEKYTIEIESNFIPREGTWRAKAKR